MTSFLTGGDDTILHRDPTGEALTLFISKIVEKPFSIVFGLVEAMKSSYEAFTLLAVVLPVEDSSVDDLLDSLT